jgi:Lecithin:cholesterol acyltransferase
MGRIHGLPRSRDAVVIVPGVMGSELSDSQTKQQLWGLRNPRWYVSAWTTGRSLEALRLSEDERAGQYGRVKATQVLRFPAFAPFLAGFAPYTALLTAVRAVACDPAAVAEFAYDWRLPVAANGRLLADFAHRHLKRWRAHCEQDAGRRADPDADQPPRLVLVSHSMGGLLVRHACLVPGLSDEVRISVTLGTPFFGAPKAVLLMAAGRGAPLPLPHARVQRLAAGLPGLHDLLPSYRCITGRTGARHLTAADIAGLGGDGELAAAAFSAQQMVTATALPGHIQVAGVRQPTVQAITLTASGAAGHNYTYRPSAAGEVEEIDAGGDGTVPRESAQLPQFPAMPLAQSHGAIASASEAIIIVQDVLTDQRTGPWQGTDYLGLDIPDLMRAGQPYSMTITGAERPTDVACSVIDVGTGLRVDAPPVRREDGALVARGQPQRPGLYWVRIDGGGASPVTQMFMVTDSGRDKAAG